MVDWIDPANGEVIATSDEKAEDWIGVMSECGLRIDDMKLFAEDYPEVINVLNAYSDRGYGDTPGVSLGFKMCIVDANTEKGILKTLKQSRTGC